MPSNEQTVNSQDGPRGGGARLTCRWGIPQPAPDPAQDAKPVCVERLSDVVALSEGTIADTARLEESIYQSDQRTACRFFRLDASASISSRDALPQPLLSGPMTGES